MKKAKNAQEATHLEELPNVGKAVARDLRKIGINHPQDLKGKDGMKLYFKLNQITGQCHDPCMADTFLSIVDFMNGARAQAWWKFTLQRKKLMLQKNTKGS